MASIIVYANDKRRFDYRNPTEINSNIHREGSYEGNIKYQLLSEKYTYLLPSPPPATDTTPKPTPPEFDPTTLKLSMFEASDILLEYFHDSDEDVLQLNETVILQNYKL